MPFAVICCGSNAMVSSNAVKTKKLSDDNRIKIDGYSLIRSDHPSDSKKGGVCIYYKEHIPLILQDDINTLDNCLVTEIRSQNEKCFLTCIYRSLSQNQDEFKNFCTNFDILLNSINDELPLCSMVTGDFNLIAQGGGKTISPTFKVKSLTHSHYQLDIIKL